MSRSRRLLGPVLVVCALASPATAAANHHLIRIREVFAGVAGNTSAQYIRLQAYSAGQNILFGTGNPPAKIQVFKADGSGPAEFSFTQNLASSADQMSVLIATSAAATYFGIAPDVTA